MYFLKAVDFTLLFEIEVDITLAVFREKLQNHTLQSAQKAKWAVEHTIFKFLPFPFFQISNDYCQKSYNGFRVFL